MPDRSAGRLDAPVGRRAWMLGCLGAGLLPTLGADEPRAEGGGVEAAEARAKAAGLGPFGTSREGHFVAVGDAAAPFREAALGLCDGLGSAFLNHFRSKGFEVGLADKPLVVVTLAGSDSYAEFLGRERAAAVGGHYDLDANWLVMFDFRPEGGGVAGVQAERVNTFVLIHEATHLLCFNAGLLDRRGDVPLAVSEGLAVYGEVWRPGRRSPLGAANRARTDAFELARRQGLDWIPLPDLLADDAPFTAADRQQLAYAQAWVFAHTALNLPTLRRRFRAYLEAIRPRRDPGHRLVDAREHLGNLDDLDSELRRRARWSR